MVKNKKHVLEHLFYDIRGCIKFIDLGFSNASELLDKMQKMSNQIPNIPTHEINTFVEMNYSEILTTKHAIKPYFEKDVKFRAYHDRIFTKYMGLKRKSPNGITILFEHLIKGITYFQNQIDHLNPIPIYHRLFSCGPSNVESDVYRSDHLICISNLTRKEKNRRRPMIERCFIERLIYNELYKHEMLRFPDGRGTNTNSQDKGHLHRLDLTKQDYETCFKNYSIDVRLMYIDNFPYGVIIERYFKGVLKSMESYTKTYSFSEIGAKTYDSQVECLKYLPLKNQTFIKYQTFNFVDMAWKKSFK